MDFKVKKQKQQMLVYWEQNTSGLQAKDSYTKVEDKDCDIQKPQIRSNENEEHVEDLMINTILIVQLHTTNEFVSSNYKSEGFGK